MKIAKMVLSQMVMQKHDAVAQYMKSNNREKTKKGIARFLELMIVIKPMLIERFIA